MGISLLGWDFGGWKTDLVDRGCARVSGLPSFVVTCRSPLRAGVPVFFLLLRHFPPWFLFVLKLQWSSSHGDALDWYAHFYWAATGIENPQTKDVSQWLAGSHTRVCTQALTNSHSR
jgi:hypothetical protein